MREGDGVTGVDPQKIEVRKYGHNVSLADGTCQNCGRPVRYNLVAPIVIHMGGGEPNDCRDPWPAESHADALVSRTTDGRVSGGTRDPGAVSDANASKPDPVDVSDEMVDTFLALQTARIDGTERVRAGLAAVVPLIRAQTLREYADRWHYVDHSRWPMSTFGAAPTPYCACGKTWPEGGCTERRNLIADASTFHEPDEPVADVVAAFEAGDKGVTKRPLSNREFLAAEIERLGLQPNVDAMWAEIENGPPMPPGWCTWHQMVDCHGDAPECREVDRG